MAILSSGPHEIPTFKGQLFKNSADEAEKLSKDLVATRDRISGLIGASEEQLKKYRDSRRNALKKLSKKYNLSDEAMAGITKVTGDYAPQHTGFFWKFVRLVTINGILILPFRGRIREEKW
jgi:hypothetical protein